MSVAAEVVTALFLVHWAVVARIQRHYEFSADRYATNNQLTYTYDNVGNTATACGAGGTTVYSYDAANNLLSAAYGTGYSCPAEGTAAPTKCVTYGYNTDK